MYELKRINKQYNYCLDFIKGIACICVVFLHCEFPGIIGVAVQAVSRWAVPFFFMVSGYYAYYDRSNGYNGNSKKKIKHIAKITLWAVVFHLLFYSIYNHFQFNVSLNDLFLWIVFNHPIIVDGALWFLFALLYTYVLYAIVDKFNLYKWAYILIIVLSIIFIFLGQGLYLMGKTDIPNCFYRNFLFEGFPWFMIGHFIHKHQNKINIKNALLIVVVVVFTVMCLAERYFIGRDFGVNISSFPQAIALFLFGVKNGQEFKGCLQTIGKEASLFVYIIHKPLWHCVEIIYSKLSLYSNSIALYIMPFIVVLLSIVLAFACNYVLKKIKTKRIV